MYLLPKLWTQIASVSSGYINYLRLEVIENKEEYKLLVPLVGIALEQVMIELEDDLLTIKTAPDESESMTDTQLLWSEFDLLGFERELRLPRNISVDKIKAKLKNGLLEVSLPKLKSNKQKIYINNTSVG